jgi:hypothetical protein
VTEEKLQVEDTLLKKKLYKIKKIRIEGIGFGTLVDGSLGGS